MLYIALLKLLYENLEETESVVSKEQAMKIGVFGLGENPFYVHL